VKRHSHHTAIEADAEQLLRDCDPAQHYRKESPLSIWLSSAARKQIPATACRKADVVGKGGRRILASDIDWLEHHAKYFRSSARMCKQAQASIDAHVKILADQFEHILFLKFAGYRTKISKFWGPLHLFI